MVYLIELKITKDGRHSMIYYLKHSLKGLIKIENGMKVGRKSGDIIFNKDEHMSSLHCQFNLKNGKLYLVDLGSKNGVKINNEIISSDMEYLILPGTMLEIGNQQFQIVQNNNLKK